MDHIHLFQLQYVILQSKFPKLELPANRWRFKTISLFKTKLAM